LKAGVRYTLGAGRVDAALLLGLTERDPGVGVAVGYTHVFDAFECAIHALAPECPHCGCKVIGHGVEADGSMYCCAHCAQTAGVVGMADRAD
jgi:hypothetical protein